LFYFGEDLGRLTLPQVRERQAFLYRDAKADRTAGKAAGDAIATAAADMMSKSGRRNIPLGEVIGVI